MTLGTEQAQSGRSQPAVGPGAAAEIEKETGMLQEPAVLARYEEFGSVTCCAHGCVHVQLGHTVMVLTEEQYLRFVAMLADSAASFEFLRDDSRLGDYGNG